MAAQTASAGDLRMGLVSFSDTIDVDQILTTYIADVEAAVQALNAFGGGSQPEASDEALKLAQEMIRQGILMVPAFGDSAVLMLEPPLVISFQQIRRVADSFAAACEQVSHVEKE
jgi:acetylornithine/succinyldiaminopimelate/putrescine aminotransferase